MSQENNLNHLPEFQPAKPAPFRMELLFNPERPSEIQVNGPVQNKVLCYGMLELAKDAIRQFHLKQQESVIQPATMGDIPGTKRLS